MNNPFNKRLTVSGVGVTINPYSEKRHKQLDEINREINDFVAKNPDATFAETKDKRANWWMRKASILWTFDDPKKANLEFFLSEDFESSALFETESFFLNYASYL